MWDKYKQYGIDVFSEHEKLELLLFLLIPRKNTNTIAHKLINKFGSLNSLFYAPLDKLQEVNGIGKNSALLLRFFGDLILYLNQSQVISRESFSSFKRIREYCAERFGNKNSETLNLLLLDDKYALLHVHNIKGNSLNPDSENWRNIIEQIIKFDSSKVVIVHNLINGTAIPSDSDLKNTREVGEILKVIDVALVDHIIISDNSALSMRSYGFLSDIWEF